MKIQKIQREKRREGTKRSVPEGVAEKQRNWEEGGGLGGVGDRERLEMEKKMGAGTKQEFNRGGT